MNAGNEPDRPPPHADRPLQFSLRTLLVAITLFSAYCGLVKWSSAPAFLILFAGSSVGGVLLVRRLGNKDVFTSVLGGAFGAAIVMGTAGYAVAFSVLSPDHAVEARLSDAWIVLHFCAFLGAIGGGIVGLLWGTISQSAGSVAQSHEEGSSPFEEEGQR